MPFGHCNCIQLHCTVWCLERSSESVEWARHFLTTKRKSLEKSMLECNSNSWRVRLHYVLPNYMCRLDHRGRSSCKCVRVQTCTSTIEMMINLSFHLLCRLKVNWQSRLEVTLHAESRIVSRIKSWSINSTCILLDAHWLVRHSIVVPQLPLSVLEKTQGVLPTSGLRIDT